MLHGHSRDRGCKVALRYPEKFTSLDGTTTVYTFSTALMEAQFEQNFRSPVSIGVGADYAHDHLGYGVSPRDPGVISIRTMAVESSGANLSAELDEARSKCYLIGKGYLYRLEADGSTRRRCLARLQSMPGLTINGNNQFGISPLVFRFLQLSDWQATSATASSATINSDPETFTINNPGDLPAYATFRARANGTTCMTNMAVTNTTNGMSFSTTRDFTAADDELRINCETLAVELSTNDGSSYANDYALFSTPADQVGIMRLEPGDNSMSIADDGTPNYDFEWSFNALYV